MKKALLVFIVAGLVLLASVLWFVSSQTSFKPVNLLHFGVIILVIGFAVFFGYKRIRSATKGEPSEDELSKKVIQKTAALSYYISLYLWVAMICFNDRFKFDTDEILGIGILGMAITFAICWLIINFRGIKNE